MRLSWPDFICQMQIFEKKANSKDKNKNNFILLISNIQFLSQKHDKRQELNSQTGEFCNKKELKSKEDEKCGERVKFKRETKNDFVNFSLTFL